jgi:hypothetical protein
MHDIFISYPFFIDKICGMNRILIEIYIMLEFKEIDLHVI